MLRNGLFEFELPDALEPDVIPEHLRYRLIQFRKHRWHQYLDSGFGSCVLRQPELARIVAISLLKFDGDRYDLDSFVVMPNHAHHLLQMRGAASLRKQCASWMRYTGRIVNRRLCRQGRFWQSEPFDHLVRSVEQLEYLRSYIADNPSVANLNPGEYLYWCRAHGFGHG